MKNKALLLLHEHYCAINILSDEEAGKLLKAVFEYDINGTEPEFEDKALTVVFLTLRHFLDSNRIRYENISRKRSENAKKRWESIREADADDGMQMHTGVINTNTNESTNENENENTNANSISIIISNENEKSNDPSPAAETEAEDCAEAEKTQSQLKPYGKFGNVMLTDSQISSLRERYADSNKRIDSLSAYISATGKQYADHYATLLSWQVYPYGKKTASERREPTFDVSAFTSKAVGIKYTPPQE